LIYEGFNKVSMKRKRRKRNGKGMEGERFIYFSVGRPVR
jgi:hypothetical protein